MYYYAFNHWAGLLRGMELFEPDNLEDKALLEDCDVVEPEIKKAKAHEPVNGNT